MLQLRISVSKKCGGVSAFLFLSRFFLFLRHPCSEIIMNNEKKQKKEDVAHGTCIRNSGDESCVKDEKRANRVCLLPYPFFVVAKKVAFLSFVFSSLLFARLLTLAL